MKYERCIKPTDVHSVVRELTETRLAWDLSTATVASGIGISDGYLRHLEQGTREPSLKLLDRWTDRLGLELSLKPKSIFE